MVDHSGSLDSVFRAIADPTRRAMIARLASAPRSVGELAEPFEISLAAASKHIQVLERAGLVRRTVKGRTHICRLEAGPLRDGVDWMRRYERFWSERLDALEAQLRADDTSAAPTPHSSTGKPPSPTAAPASRPAPTVPPGSRPAPSGPRIVPLHERPSRRQPGRKGS